MRGRQVPHALLTIADDSPAVVPPSFLCQSFLP
jgi:hypothetical protein